RVKGHPEVVVCAVHAFRRDRREARTLDRSPRPHDRVWFLAKARDAKQGKKPHPAHLADRPCAAHPRGIVPPTSVRSPKARTPRPPRPRSPPPTSGRRHLFRISARLVWISAIF